MRGYGRQGIVLRQDPGEVAYLLLWCLCSLAWHCGKNIITIITHHSLLATTAELLQLKVNSYLRDTLLIIGASMPHYKTTRSALVTEYNQSCPLQRGRVHCIKFHRTLTCWICVVESPLLFCFSLPAESSSLGLLQHNNISLLSAFHTNFQAPDQKRTSDAGLDHVTARWLPSKHAPLYKPHLLLGVVSLQRKWREEDQGLELSRKMREWRSVGRVGK